MNEFSRRSFLRTTGLAAAGILATKLAVPASRAALLAKNDAEAALRGKDANIRGPYHLGKEIYRNPLHAPSDVADFRLEGEASVTFPKGRMRLENKLDPALGQKSNFVYWFAPELPADFAASWEFSAIRDPGLCMVFFGARGRDGKDIFDSSKAKRSGEYPQYHHGDINTLHLSYFRRSKPGEREFQVCNLRKSYGFNLVAEGADPLPPVATANPPYLIELIKHGPEIAFFIDRLPVLQWTDDGKTFGPVLGSGRFGFRQMAPLQAEYENFVVREVSRL